MQKNVADQNWRVFAFNRNTNLPVTGDAAQITAKIRLNAGALNGTNDTNPTELEDGYYEFDLTQAETNADVLELYPESSTSNVQVIGVPGEHVPIVLQTGDSFARIGATGSGLTSLAQASLVTAARMGALTDWINGGRLDLILDIIAVDTTTDIPSTLSTIAGYIDTEIGTIITAVGTTIENHLTDIKGATFSGATDSLEAIRNRGDAAWPTATSVTVSDKTGFSLAADQSGVTIGTVTLVTTTTTNTDMVSAAPTATQIWQLAAAIDGKTPQEALRYIAAGMAGEVSGAGTGTEIFVGLDGVTTRMTVTVDASGNRSSISYD